VTRNFHDLLRSPLTAPSVIAAIAFLVSLSGVGTPQKADAQATAVGPASPQIVKSVDESNLVTLEGNTRSEASQQYDRGMVSDRMPLEHLQLLLRRPEAQENTLEKLIASQTDRTSPNYHKWLTAGEFGTRFGVAEQDLATITKWLSAHGSTSKACCRAGW